LKLGPPQADSNDDPQITTAAELKNQSALTTSSSPASTKKDISSLRSSDTTEKPSKSTQPGAGACKPSGEEGWKRGLSGKRKTSELRLFSIRKVSSANYDSIQSSFLILKMKVMKLRSYLLFQSLLNPIPAKI